jgi:hypothetical protein
LRTTSGEEEGNDISLGDMSGSSDLEDVSCYLSDSMDSRNWGDTSVLEKVSGWSELGDSLSDFSELGNVSDILSDLSELGNMSDSLSDLSELSGSLSDLLAASGSGLAKQKKKPKGEPFI